MKKIFVLFFVLVTTTAFSQTSFIRNSTIPVKQYGLNSPLAWAGGLNDASFSDIDLNGDGIKDLFVFEKDNGNIITPYRISTYINNGIAGQVSYSYAPEYISKFPPLSEFALLKDYDCDGLEDIFTYSVTGQAGMSVYKNTSTPGNLQFQLTYPIVQSTYTFVSNLYVSRVNQPGLSDIDNDGDLDVITFPVIGSYMEFHKNYAQENFGRCDTFIYEYDGGCWGHCFLNGYNNSATLGALCKMPVVNPPMYEPVNSKSLHSGSCMTIFDYDKDGDKEVINGDVLGNNLLFLNNGGDSSSANFTSQDSLFPSYDISCNLFTFHDPSIVDVNNDGLKDLIVSPCTNGGAENYNCVWFYKNIGNSSIDSFSYQTTSFLIDQMIDVGEAANPKFFDADNDGLMDLIVGNYGYFQTGGGYLSGLAWYKNTGTATAPEFNLQTTDYASLSSLNLLAVHPSFGDLDGDNVEDMLVGDDQGKVHFFKNLALIGQPANFSLTGPTWFTIDVGKFAAPCIYDLNNDGLNDIIIGDELGKLHYFKNTGTATSPVFASGYGQDSLGHVTVARYPNVKGFADPVFFENNGQTDLMVGTASGYIYYYTNITNNLNGTFALLDSEYKDVSELMLAAIDLYDIDGNGLADLIIGNNAGGIIIYNQIVNSSINENNSNLAPEFSIYPIPASDYINIKVTNSIVKDFVLEIYDNLGQKIFDKKITDTYSMIETKGWHSGLYYCRVSNNIGITNTKKIIIQK